MSCAGACVDLNGVTNCGGCGNVCPVRSNAQVTCRVGTCGFSCNPGYADCNGMNADGCEANLTTSIAHCGRCNNVCNATNGTASCMVGACGILCATGFDNCDGNVDNGCESNLSAITTCGSCRTTCPSGQVCTTRTCAVVCPASLTNCNMSCVDPMTDRLNCGRCGNRCPVPSNTGATCVAGTSPFKVCSLGSILTFPPRFHRGASWWTHGASS